MTINLNCETANINNWACFREYAKTAISDYRNRTKNRAALKELGKLDDSQLKDIGISRADLHWAKMLPATQDATIALELIARGHVKK